MHVSFQVSKRTAKNKQRRLGGKIMNYAWDANRDGQNYSDGFKSIEECV